MYLHLHKSVATMFNVRKIYSIAICLISYQPEEGNLKGLSVFKYIMNMSATGFRFCHAVLLSKHLLISH